VQDILKQEQYIVVPELRTKESRAVAGKLGDR